jgi:hypothetical protein
MISVTKGMLADSEHIVNPAGYGKTFATHAAPLVVVAAGAAEARSSDLGPAKARSNQRRIRGVEIRRSSATGDRLRRLISGASEVIEATTAAP